MGSGGGKNRGDEQSTDEQENIPEWLSDLENWDEQTRRQFLAVLVATISGILTAIILYTQDMFETVVDIDERTGDPPTNIFVQEYDSEYRATYADGEVIESGSDGWAVLSAAVRTIPSGGTLFVKGRYDATSTLEITKSMQLHGHGASITVDESVSHAFEISGEERYQTELVDSVETGGYNVQLEASDDIQKGDMLLFEDAGGEAVLGRGQPAGEPHSVLGVDGNTVTLEDTIIWRGGYDSGTLVYVINPIEIQCSGFDLEGPAKDETYVGIMARECRNSVFEGLFLDKFGSRGIALEGCANSRIRDCTVIQSADIEASDGYGIQIRAGCHDILVEGCTAKECRHPFSITPAGPREVASRSVTVRDCFVSSDGSAALNCHGGSAHDITFDGCMVHTWGQPGVRTGAQKTKVSGCEFRMEDHHAITTRNDGQEMVITVSDTDIYGAGNAINLSNDEDYEFAPLWKLVHIDGVRANDCYRFFHLESGRIDRVRNLVIRNSCWDAVGETGIRIENRLDGGSIKGNTFGDAPNDAHISTRRQEGTNVTNLHISENRFEQSSNADTFIQLANATRCTISNNKFESESGGGLYTDDANSTQNIVKQNTYFGPVGSGNMVAVDADSIAADNYFMDTS